MKPPDLSQPQLFLDNAWIAESSFVSREWHQPRKVPQPVLVAEHPWEEWCPVMYGTVLRWRGRFRMWYCGWTRGVQPRVCYAESDDGVKWTKPSLGLYEFNGSTENNIVLQSANPDHLIDDISVIDDAHDEEWPLKALFWDGAYRNGKMVEGTGIYLARSQDGIRWDRSPGLVLPQWGDRFNASPCRVNGKYILLGRAPSGIRHSFDVPLGRAVWRIESENLTDWSEPKLVLAADVEDPTHLQYYSATAFPYSDLLLGSIERMQMSPDKLDPEIIWSRDDGQSWQRAAKRPTFIERGSDGAWDDTWINLPTNAPIAHEGRLWFYYSGRSGAHGARVPLNFGGIGLAILRVDGFASLRAEEKTGFVLTPPMQWPGGELYLNVDPRRNIATHPGYETGELSVEAHDENNQPLEGFGWDDCVPLRRNTADYENASAPVKWKNDKTLHELAGRRIRFLFRLRDCHLYSFHTRS